MSDIIKLYDESKDIDNLFNNKGWVKDTTDKKSLYNRYLITYRNLDEEQQAIFLELSSKFIYIPLGQYEDLFLKLVKKMIVKYSEYRTYYIRPLKRSRDLKLIKSSDVMLYLFKATFLKYIEDINCKNFKTSFEIDPRSEKHKNQKIFLIDDFIGTGTYADGVIEDMIQKNICIEDIVVLTVYINKIALEYFKNKNIEVIYLYQINSVLEELNDREKSLLKELGHKNYKFKFGYQDSGNLISLMRTPNNTMSLFWSGKNAPFERK